MSNEHAQRRQRDNTDRLPPHSPEAEESLLACCLLDNKHIAAAVAFFQGQPVFYFTERAVIFAEMAAMQAEQLPVDVVTLWERLKQQERIIQAGGFEYLTALPDKVFTAANADTYLAIIWEKYEARQFLASMVDGAAQVYTSEEGLLPVLSGIKARLLLIEASAARRLGTMPAHLKRLDAFETAYWNMWFGDQAGEPGLPLPFEFPFKVRRGELSFLIAEKGAGKSTLLGYILLHLMAKGEKCCIASMEMKPEVTLKMMAAQLLGTKHLPDNGYGHKQALAAYEWLRSRVMIYDFLGIADWRDLHQTFDHAATAGCTQFQIDSVMRMGIPDDDYAQQGLAAQTFASWSQSRNVHCWIVNHLNKSDKGTKQRSRGSQQWIDNSNNVLSVHLNEEKGAFMEKLREELRLGQIDEKEYNEKLQSKADKFDSYFQLHNQRWPGSRQNGSRYLFFNRDSLQLHERPFTESINWLALWGAATGGEKTV